MSEDSLGPVGSDEGPPGIRLAPVHLTLCLIRFGSREVRLASSPVCGGEYRAAGLVTKMV